MDVDLKNIIPVNEIVFCGIRDGSLDVYIIPEMEVDSPLDRFSEGLKKMADIVEGDKSIRKIRVISGIVDEYPKVMELFGFTVIGGPHGSPTGRTDEGNGEAETDRESFLKNYLE